MVTGLALAAASVAALAERVQAEELPPQTVLQPGLYLFQTRTRSGTCPDAPRTGYVTSAVATLDGVPGSRSLTLRVLSSKYWPRWELTVATDDTIVGTATMFGKNDPQKGTSRFEVKAYKDRFQGTGSREYPAPPKSDVARCTLLYDALLKPIE